MSFVENQSVYNMLVDHYLSERRSNDSMSGGFFEDLFDTVTDGIEGLTDALQGALESAISAISHIGETIALIVRAAIGDVSWNEVLGELGAVFQDIGAVLVYLNPYRMGYEWLKEAPLTSHAFNELDKFTGGWITTGVNISTLPWRAMRGDPISKVELIQDALLIITVIAIVYTGPVALGVLLGTMVGREVCSKQTEAKDACLVAFQIVGAAVATWASSASQVTWGLAAETSEAYAAGEISAAEQSAWLAGDEAYQAFLSEQGQTFLLADSTSFLTHLTAAGENYLLNAGLNTATQHAAQLCQAAHLLGNKECQILSQVAADYYKAPSDISWEEFLAQEVARIGVEELMLEWFPPDSPEAAAIRKWQIRYVDVPVDQRNIVQTKLDPKVLLLLAGGAAMVLMGAS
jgi:hypothetical protein